MKTRSLSLFILFCLAATPISFADMTTVIKGDDEDRFFVTMDKAKEEPQEKSETPSGSQESTPVAQEKYIPSTARTTVISAKELEDNQYTTVIDAIRDIPGVSMNEQVPGNSAFIKINGTDRVTVLVDGINMANAQGQAYGRGTVDATMLPGVSAIDHIEVTRGVGSAAYGSGAVGGVINIVTKKGDVDQTKVNVSTGSWGSHHYGLTTQGKSGSTSWTVAGDIQKRKYYKFADGDHIDASRGDYDEKKLWARVDEQLNDDNSLTAFFYHQDRDGHGSSFDIRDGKFDLTDNKMTERLMNMYALTWHFNESTTNPGFLRYYNTYQKTHWTNRFHTRTQVVEGEHIWTLGNHAIRAGAGWKLDSGTNTNAGYIDKKRMNRHAYIEDTMTYGKWKIVPGVRYDDNSEFGDHHTPRIAFQYDANDKVSFFANWGRVFQAPNLNDLFYFKESTKSGKRKISHGNKDLRPETGYSQSAGVTWKKDDSTTFTFTWFKSSLHDAIRWNRSNRYDVYPDNLNLEKRQGIEVTMDKTINDHWSYAIGYSYVHSRIDEGDGLGFDNSYNRPNGYTGGLHYKSNRFRANLNITAGTGRDASYYLNRSYVVWNANMVYDVSKDMQVYAKVNNLTNEGYDLYHEYPAAGRYWQIGATYSF